MPPSAIRRRVVSTAAKAPRSPVRRWWRSRTSRFIGCGNLGAPPKPPKRASGWGNRGAAGRAGGAPRGGPGRGAAPGPRGRGGRGEQALARGLGRRHGGGGCGLEVVADGFGALQDLLAAVL